MVSEVSVYDEVGGDAWFVALVDRFYTGVEGDARLRPLYPDDLTESRANLSGFLIQYWGGPTDYSDQRGHPRLRMRHAPFPIGAVERDAWLEHMNAAVRAGGLDEALQGQMLDYFAMAAAALVNQVPPPNPRNLL